jgi:hypothetical protein
MHSEHFDIFHVTGFSNDILLFLATLPSPNCQEARCMFKINVKLIINKSEHAMII